MLLEAAVENYVDLYIGFPTYAFLEALGLSIGVKVGKVMAATLLFSCAVNKGEILQMQYRPSYVLVPTMEAILYKFKGRNSKTKNKSDQALQDVGYRCSRTPVLGNK